MSVAELRIRERCLTPQQEAVIRRLSQAVGGPTAEGCIGRVKTNAHGRLVRALAAQYGVSARAIYRAIERGEESIYELELSGYTATFTVGDLGPVQRTPWVPA